MSSSAMQAIAIRPIKARAPRFVLTAIAALVASAWGAGANAGPEGGVVQAGAATIKQTSPTRVDINQSTQRAVINWKSFNVGAAEHVNFQQPSAQSATLNRIGGVNPSAIHGRITANGQIFLINSNGILFGPKAKIEVGSLVAATANIGNENFMAGRLKFDEVVNRNARIINQGHISVSQGGLVALVAPGVENSGIIQATLGKVALASGNAFTLDFYGDKLIQLAVDDKVMAALTDAQGKPLNAYVNHTGTIEADGGNVLITAAAAKTVLDKVINVSGVVQARSFTQHGGQIVLHGGDEGKVEVAGKLDASGKEPNAKGGNIAVLGQDVRLTSSATLDASGPAGGGTVKVGGDYQGKGDLQRSRSTTVDAGSVIRADALQAGDGGRVIVWSDGSTRYAGTISARGGVNSGNGGFVEVSGIHGLVFAGNVALHAPSGRPGKLLLDPTSFAFETVGDTEAGRIADVLRQGADVEVAANTITVNALIDGRGGEEGGGLTLLANGLTGSGDLLVNNDIVTNNGDVVLKATGNLIVSDKKLQITTVEGAVIEREPLIYTGRGRVSASASGQTLSLQYVDTVGAVEINKEISSTTASAVALHRQLGSEARPIGDLTVSGRKIDLAADVVSVGNVVLNAGSGGLTASETGGVNGPTLLYAGTKSIDIVSGGEVSLQFVDTMGRVTIDAPGQKLRLNRPIGSTARPVASLEVKQTGAIEHGESGGDIVTRGPVALNSSGAIQFGDILATESGDISVDALKQIQGESIRTKGNVKVSSKYAAVIDSTPGVDKPRSCDICSIDIGAIGSSDYRVGGLTLVATTEENPDFRGFIRLGDVRAATAKDGIQVTASGEILIQGTIEDTGVAGGPMTFNGNVQLIGDDGLGSGGSIFAANRDVTFNGTVSAVPMVLGPVATSGTYTDDGDGFLAVSEIDSMYSRTTGTLRLDVRSVTFNSGIVGYDYKMPRTIEVPNLVPTEQQHTFYDIKLVVPDQTTFGQFSTPVYIFSADNQLAVIGVGSKSNEGENSAGTVQTAWTSTQINALLQTGQVKLIPADLSDPKSRPDPDGGVPIPGSPGTINPTFSQTFGNVGGGGVPTGGPGLGAFRGGGGGGGGGGGDGNRFTGIPPQDNGRNYSQGEGLLGLILSGDRGLARVADLGRSSTISGGGVDVFQARYHVIGTSQEPGGVTVDSAYVGKSPFEYMDERAARGRAAP